MSLDNSQIEDIRKRLHLSPVVGLFYLQGGFAPDKIKGLDKFLIGVVRKITIKKLSGKQDLSDIEKDALDLFINGGSRVKKEALSDVITYLKDQT